MTQSRPWVNLNPKIREMEAFIDPPPCEWTPFWAQGEWLREVFSLVRTVANAKQVVVAVRHWGRSRVLTSWIGRLGQTESKGHISRFVVIGMCMGQNHHRLKWFVLLRPERYQPPFPSWRTQLWVSTCFNLDPGDPDPKWLSLFSVAVPTGHHGRCPSFTPRHLANAAWALAELRVLEEEEFQESLKSGGNPWGSIGFYHNFHCFL